MKLIKEKERIDDLQYKNLRIIQNIENFRFGIDSILLANFATDIKKGSKVVDLGTGSGVIGILLCAKTELSNIIGVEIQEEIADMARRSIILNKMEHKFTIINCNIKDLKNKIKPNSIDVIVSNPPYKKYNTGKKNRDLKKTIARHEVMGELEDFIQISKYLLKEKGELYFVHRPERLGDIIENLRRYKLEPKIMRFVFSKQDEGAKLILLKCVKNAKPFLKIEKPLIIYDSYGNYTEEVLKIYK